MSTQGKLVTSAIVVALAVAAFLAIGGALFAFALLVLLAWILAMLLREREARLSNGFWWKLTLSGVGVLAITALVLRRSLAAVVARRGAERARVVVGHVRVRHRGSVMIIGGLLSGVVQLASRRPLSH